MALSAIQCPSSASRLTVVEGSTPQAHGGATTTRKPSITPETFADVWLAKPDLHQELYGVPQTALRRELAGVLCEILRSESPNLLPGNMLRAMVRAKEITVAEAVSELWNTAEADAETNGRFSRDPVVGPLWDRYCDLVEQSDGEGPALTPEEKAEKGRIEEVMSDREKVITLEILRNAGESEIADLAEFFPGTLSLMRQINPHGFLCVSELEPDRLTELKVVDKYPGRSR